jgi:hypothetical protein
MTNVKLASAQCATCIFRPNSGFDLDEFRKRWGAYGHQVCHNFRVKGQRHATHPDVWCRGYFENELSPEMRQIIGLLAEIVPQKVTT